MKLTDAQIHMIKLIVKGRKPGFEWAKTSEVVMSLVQAMPKELVEWDEAAMTVRLTEEGNAVHRAMKWLL